MRGGELWENSHERWGILRKSHERWGIAGELTREVGHFWEIT